MSGCVTQRKFLSYRVQQVLTAQVLPIKLLARQVASQHGLLAKDAFPYKDFMCEVQL